MTVAYRNRSDRTSCRLCIHRRHPERETRRMFASSAADGPQPRSPGIEFTNRPRHCGPRSNRPVRTHNRHSPLPGGPSRSSCRLDPAKNGVVEGCPDRTHCKGIENRPCHIARRRARQSPGRHANRSSRSFATPLEGQRAPGRGPVVIADTPVRRMGVSESGPPSSPPIDRSIGQNRPH